MTIGSLVRSNPNLSILKPHMLAGIVIENNLIGTNDLGFEYEYKSVVRVSWPDGTVSEHFEDELEVIS